MTARMAAAAGALVLFALSGSAQDRLPEIPPPPTPVGEKGTPPASLGAPVPLPPTPAPAFTAPPQPGPTPPAPQRRRLFNGRLRNRVRSILHLGGQP